MSFLLLFKHIKTKIYRTITLPVILYVFETWSLTLRMFENGVRIKIYGHKKDEVTSDSRRLHSEEPNDLHSSPSITQVTKIKKNEIDTYEEQVKCIHGFGWKT